MVELIASIVFIGSIAGIGIIAARRMPQAMREAQLSPEAKLLNFRDAAKNWFAVRLKNNRYLKDFSWIDFVQKRLLKVRVLVMKAENKINEYTVKLRERAENQKKKEEALLDNYWHDLRTIVKTKKTGYKRNSKTSAAESEAAPDEDAVDGDAIAGSAEAKAEPMIGRVVMPAQVLPREPRGKKKHNSKKKKIKDPFKW